MRELNGILQQEVENYRKNQSDMTTRLIADWPKQSTIRGWFVRLLRNGHQRAHNHPDGWLSGCLYLRMPESKGTDEGAIEFLLKKPSFPDIADRGPVFTHQPREGQLVLFPSSLFHRTIQFRNDEERLCIAFDVAPIG